jgi:hypothetical protein
LLVLVVVISGSCKREATDAERTTLLEVEGKFLYLDQVQDIIPPNMNKEDSAQIATSFIKKWITDVLIYENAKRNITNKAEIDQLLEDYRKSLIIHQYQQKLIEQKLPKEPTEQEMMSFYEQFEDQFTLKENIIRGFFLVVPANAPKISSVRSWVQSGNTKSLESIEKYSIQNAISYDYFGNQWTAFSEILKKLPVQIEDPASYISRNRFIEVTDSTKYYFLRIESYRTIGNKEPFEMAKPKISNLIMNKLKAEFISNFEDEIYQDAINNGSVNVFNEK